MEMLFKNATSVNEILFIFIPNSLYDWQWSQKTAISHQIKTSWFLILGLGISDAMFITLQKACLR